MVAVVVLLLCAFIHAEKLVHIAGYHKQQQQHANRSTNLCRPCARGVCACMVIIIAVCRAGCRGGPCGAAMVVYICLTLTTSKRWEAHSSSRSVGHRLHARTYNSDEGLFLLVLCCMYDCYSSCPTDHKTMLNQSSKHTDTRRTSAQREGNQATSEYSYVWYFYLSNQSINQCRCRARERKITIYMAPPSGLIFSAADW